ncbi:MAG: ABC transporter substrate-binding protein [Campylobacterota bacterium]|nr:ABC transporter substrate-binding protein [Campylobacterota bacterium]
MKLLLAFLIFVITLFAQQEDVVLQLQWKHQFQFAGFYVAKEQGFYEQAGLDVEIRELEYSMSVTNEVLSGRAEYGVGRSSLLISKSSGKDVVALGAIFQTSPSILISTNPDVKTPEDLVNKTVMINGEEAESASMIAMLLSHGVSMKDLKLQEHTFNLEDLISKKTDAMACYLSNEPFLLDELNISYQILNPKDYGYDFYGDILFTSQSQIKKNPEAVKRFYDASMKGWRWAFDNIELTAELIKQKYNSQNKSLRSLIYEGNVLKQLAFSNDVPFGYLSNERFEEIADAYRLSGLLKGEYSTEGFIDPIGLNKKHIKIGVLAKRGKEQAIQRWSSFENYLNNALEAYHFKIVPLDFSALVKSVQMGEVDFVLTNTMQYVQFENKYGVSRIATVENLNRDGNDATKRFGGVIFTLKDNHKFNTLKELKGTTFGAVNKDSFGGWIMAHELLEEHGVSKKDLNLKFLNSHDAVVYALLEGDVEAATVRTDTLERMAADGLINLEKIRVLNAQSYEGFCYMVSTKLYPEWPFSKLKNTSDKLSKEVLSALMQMPASSKAAVDAKIFGWTAPLNYISVHALLKKLKIAPYESHGFNFVDVLEKYIFLFYLVGAVSIAVILIIIYEIRINSYLKGFNSKLESEVKERTKELKKLAHTDALTGIYNRGYFIHLAKSYFDLAKRNGTPLQVLSLDIDYFKHINDTYGHSVGDEVLKLFTSSIEKYLRKSDIFGRIGGEEFVICLQNTPNDGAMIFAQKLLEVVEKASYTLENGEKISCTVSIGIAHLNDEESFEELLKNSDEALYAAKNSGRNRASIY